MQDLMNALHPLIAIAPAAAITDNTPAQSVVIDRQGYDSLTFILLTGALADPDATFTTLIEHADTNWTGAAAVPDSELVGTEAFASFTFADDNECRKIGYAGAKRYVRLTVTPSANAGNAFIAAVALLGAAGVQPTANPPA